MRHLIPGSDWLVRTCLTASVSTLLLTTCVITSNAAAQEVRSSASAEREAPSRDILSEQTWDDIAEASDRALSYLAEHQRLDGSFDGPALGQPGITGLCTLAFLANGHLPGQGKYGEQLAKAVDFIVEQQKDNGLLSTIGPSGPVVKGSGNFSHDEYVAGAYNHAIAGLALSEAYGATGALNDEKLRISIERAVEFSLKQQRWPQFTQTDEGGWRYLHTFAGTDADLPVTGWQIMLLRSAKNAGFKVPQKAIDDAGAYVVRCFNKQRQMFDYDATGNEGRNRAMAGVGILALSHTSQHDRPEIMAAADFILDEGFPNYNRTNTYNPTNPSERYHYSVCQCTLAMYQVGGKHWSEFFPATAESLLAHQNKDGSWDEESNRDAMYGQSYTTALVVIALSAPNQLLPIYQR